MVFGATTFRQFVQMLASSTAESDVRDPWVTRMRSMPATAVATTLPEPPARPDAGGAGGSAGRAPGVARMRRMPAAVVSATLHEPLDWPDATVVSGDAVDVVARI